MATIKVTSFIDHEPLKGTTLLGTHTGEGRADTKRTFTTCCIRKDGSGYILVERDGKTLHQFIFNPEE